MMYVSLKKMKQASRSGEEASFEVPKWWSDDSRLGRGRRMIRGGLVKE